jgi:hypothetical protein
LNCFCHGVIPVACKHDLPQKNNKLTIQACKEILKVSLHLPLAEMAKKAGKNYRAYLEKLVFKTGQAE